MILLFEKTNRHYVHIINPRKFSWRNLPMSTFTSMSLSVSMDTDMDMDMDVDVDMGRSRDVLSRRRFVRRRFVTRRHFFTETFC
jgi:hypothetical protein